MRFGQMKMHCIHHLLGGVRPSHCQHSRVHGRHHIPARFILLCTQAPGDDDPTVFSQGFANRVQALLDSIVNETAGIDDDQISALECLGGLIPLSTQLGQDQF